MIRIATVSSSKSCPAGRVHDGTDKHNIDRDEEKLVMYEAIALHHCHYDTSTHEQQATANSMVHYLISEPMNHHS